MSNASSTTVTMATVTSAPSATSTISVTLTERQREALDWLSNVLDEATKTGLLDVLQPHCRQPDAINDVCEAVTFMFINQNGENEDTQGATAETLRSA